jgi:hypothetical protein
MNEGKRAVGLFLIFALATIAFATACSRNAASMSPTEVFKAYYDASMKKDYATAKQYLSKNSQALLEKAAQAQNKSLEEMMSQSADVAKAQNETPQYGNEQINGDTATIDVSGKGQTVKMPFVKEDGGWKIAIDKVVEVNKGKLGSGK